MDCSFQIFTDGQWVDCAELHVHGSGKSTFVYDPRFAFTHSECVSLKYPVTVDMAAEGVDDDIIQFCRQACKRRPRNFRTLPRAHAPK
ncbi:MAG: hypothetical protein PPHEMADM_5043 [uncultured Paraburkholderia sp.]|nr:MAG: hypothetical protein PPHEMADE_5016 [uncultured Paraburkholderia sp.]CAH2941581.1 MAG: hypothetical protein PPHEMADM_5043 [uncultured Paraburkholderia sp.]